MHIFPIDSKKTAFTKIYSKTMYMQQPSGHLLPYREG
jgi:hypothetical protein